MKLKVRTIKNEEVEIVAEPADNILEIKKKIHEAFVDKLESEKLTLIHAGKILADDQTLSSYPAIKEHDKLVVMQYKTAKATPVAPSPPPPPPPVVIPAP